MYRKFFIHLLGIVAIYFTLHFLSITYTFNDFKEYSTILLSSAGMVFTLMGIWIAFLYPNALSRIVNPEIIATADFSESLQETKRLEALVASVLRSALVVMFLTLIFLLKVIFWKTNIYAENIDLIKTGALSISIMLFILQTEAVYQVVYSNIMFINDLHRRREDRQADDDI
jgi:hypothetical protein